VAVTIPGAVASAAREFGDAPALVDTALAEPGLADTALADTALAEPGLAEPDGLRLSYRELDERVTAMAAALIAQGVAPADRVAIWAPNTSQWVLAALGALSAGATLVPVSTRFTGPEALDVISRSGARALFVAGDFLGVDRLAALRAAAAAEADGTGGGALDQVGLIVRLPEDWAAFERCGASVPAAVVRERADGVRPHDVMSWRQRMC
jgi:HIP---CoA ligase